MTLNTKIEFFLFFGNFGLRDSFQERIAPKSLEIDKKKLYMKFSALNVFFDDPSLCLLGSRKPAQEGIKDRCPLKLLFYRCASLSCCLSQQALVMSILVVSTINIDDFERFWTLKIGGFIVSIAIFGCGAHFKSTGYCDEMAGDRLRQLMNRNCYRISLSHEH